MQATPPTQPRRRRDGAEPHRIVSLVQNAKKPLVAISDFGRIVAINAVAAALLGAGGDALARDPEREAPAAGVVKREAESPRKARERIGTLLARFPDAHITRVHVTTSQFSGWLVILGRERESSAPTRTT
jgi:hypothetical protein